MGRRPPTCKEKSCRVLHGRKHSSCCRYQPTDNRGKDFNPGLSSLKGWAGSEPQRAARRESWSHPRICPHEGSPLGAEPCPQGRTCVLRPGVGGVVCVFGGPAVSAASAAVHGGAGSSLDSARRVGRTRVGGSIWDSAGRTGSVWAGGGEALWKGLSLPPPLLLRGC